MQTLSFDSGIKHYAVNGDEGCIISVNTADLNLPVRYAEMMPKINALADEMKSSDPVPELIADYDRRFRELLNGIFGSDVCTPAFGCVNCLSPVGDGKLLFEAFLEAFVPLIGKDIGERLEAANARMDKYISRVTD